MEISSAYRSVSPEIQEAYEKGRLHENQRILRELHDGLAQELLGVRMQLSALESYEISVELLALIVKINVGIDRSLHTLNGIITDSTPSYLIHRSFDQILRQTFEGITTIPIEIHGSTLLHFQENGVALEILRIIQEFVRNSLKHSKASHVRIELRQLEEGVFIHLKDDGIGFDLQETTTGMGVGNLYHRLMAIAAEHDYSSSKEHGTQLSFKVYEDNN